MIAPTLNAALASVQAAIDSMPGTLQNASRVQLAPVAVAVTNALMALDAQTTADEAAIDQTTVAGVTPLTAAPALAMRLLSQSGLVNDLSTLKTARGYLARVGVNVANATG